MIKAFEKTVRQGTRHAGIVGMALALAVWYTLPAAAQFVSGSNGSDGSITFALPSGQTSVTYAFDPATICAQAGVTCSLGSAAQLDVDGDNIYHFETVSIAHREVTVRLRASRLRHTGPVVWLATGDVTLGGTLNLSGTAGHVGGQNIALRGPSEPGPGGFPGGAGAKPGDVAQRGAGPGGGVVPANSTQGCSAGHVVEGTQHARCVNGGRSYGTTLIQPLVGGSGGSGGHYTGTNQGAGAGAGGGAIRISSAGTILVREYGIYADGGAPGSIVGGQYAGAGSGGAIHLQAPKVVLSAFGGSWGIFARGATGAYNGNAWESSADGRIRFDTDSFTQSNGSINPSPLVGPLVSVPLPGPPPVVRLTSIGGIPAPANPQNAYTLPDVSIDSASPVAFEVQANNIPVGTVLRLHVTSDGTGESVDRVVNSSPLAGTLATSTATAMVPLPQGVSRVYVRATW